MMPKNLANRILTISNQIYQALLLLYPEAHRREYGPLMAQVFRDMCRDAYRQNGAWGVLGSWLPVLLDLAITAFEEHRKEGIRMSKESLIHWSGPILIVGGVLHMVAGFGPLQPGSCCNGNKVVVMMIVPALVLLAIGLAGVHARFAPRTNRLGRLGLIAAIACAPTFAVICLLVFAEIVAWNVMERVGIPLWLLQGFGTVLFGIAAMQTGALSRWNALPVLIGLLPFLIFLTNADEQVVGPNYIAFGVLVLVGLGYGLLGYVVHADVARREMAAA